MANSAHTPGPWIRSKYGFQVLTGDSKRIVCSINLDDRDEQVANARLIAATPDMYAALEAALDALDELIGADYDLSGEQDMIRAALEKARGA